MAQETNIREETTGAIRSSDLDKERWDLISGIAVRQLRTIQATDAGQYPAEALVEIAINYVWRFLGYDHKNVEYDCIKWIHPTGTREELLLRGWHCISLAIEKIETFGLDVRLLRSPSALSYYALRSIARACAEGVVKYGEENWHNGFRTKEVTNHALSHMIKWTNGFSDEDDLGHACWNFMVAVHNLNCRPEMNDLLLGESYTLTDEIKAYHVKKKEERGIFDASHCSDHKSDTMRQATVIDMRHEDFI